MLSCVTVRNEEQQLGGKSFTQIGLNKNNIFIFLWRKLHGMSNIWMKWIWLSICINKIGFIFFFFFFPKRQQKQIKFATRCSVIALKCNDCLYCKHLIHNQKFSVAENKTHWGVKVKGRWEAGWYFLQKTCLFPKWKTLKWWMANDA